MNANRLLSEHGLNTVMSWYDEIQVLHYAHDWWVWKSTESGECRIANHCGISCEKMRGRKLSALAKGKMDCTLVNYSLSRQNKPRGLVTEFNVRRVGAYEF